MSWPTRRHVDEHIANLLGNTRRRDKAATLIELGLQHEQQHQEVDRHGHQARPILHPIRCTRPMQRAETPRAATPNAKPQEWVEFPGGLKQIGHNGEGFCFDNELPRHNVFVQPFRLASRPVTCAEYLSFIEEGGYRRAELWLSEELG